MIKDYCVPYFMNIIFLYIAILFEPMYVHGPPTTQPSQHDSSSINRITDICGYARYQWYNYNLFSRELIKPMYILVNFPSGIFQLL